MNDRSQAILWASGILANTHNYVILDSETTDLDGEIVDLAIINLNGNTLFQSLFNPTMEISPAAAAIHHLTRERLQNEPRWETRRDEIQQVIGSRIVLIYNAAFDSARLHTTCVVHDVNQLDFHAECVMEWYAQFVGEWNSYYGNYRWQRLIGGDHSALGDCLATLDVIQRMAISTLQEYVSHG